MGCKGSEGPRKKSTSSMKQESSFILRSRKVPNWSRTTITLNQKLDQKFGKETELKGMPQMAYRMVATRPPVVTHAMLP